MNDNFYYIYFNKEKNNCSQKEKIIKEENLQTHLCAYSFNLLSEPPELESEKEGKKNYSAISKKVCLKDCEAWSMREKAGMRTHPIHSLQSLENT